MRMKWLLFASAAACAWWYVKHQGLRLEALLPARPSQIHQGVHSPPPSPVRKPDDTILVATVSLRPPLSSGPAAAVPDADWLASLIGRYDVLAIQQLGLASGSWLADAARRASASGRQYDFLLVDPRDHQGQPDQTFAVVFDTASVQIDRPASHCVRDPHALLAHPPLVCPFRVRGMAESQAFTFTLVSIYVDANEVQREIETLADVYREVRRASGGEDDVILIGTVPQHADIGRLETSVGLRSPLGAAAVALPGVSYQGHILLREDSTSEFTGKVAQMTPAEWSEAQANPAEALLVCPPVSAEFTAFEQLARRPVATRPQAIDTR